jgi:K+-transporting ATPase c subunit
MCGSYSTNSTNGSVLFGQNFIGDRYSFSRPNAINYDTNWRIILLKLPSFVELPE